MTDVSAKPPLLQDELVIKVSRSLLPSNDRCYQAAIDCGSELTKIVYTTESDDADGETSQLRFALFQNGHLADALDFLKTKLPEPGHSASDSSDSGKMRLRVTGHGVSLHGDMIREKLNVDLNYIDESSSHCTGLYFLLKHFPDNEEFCHQTPVIDETEFAGMEHGETFKRLIDAHAAAMAEEGSGLESRFPCILVVYGSTGGVFRINEDGSSEVLQTMNLAGKSFLGISQLLIGTCNYEELMQLAAVGKRGNIDTEVRDLMDGANPDSPYGRLPPSLPFFGFGKGVDLNRGLEETRKEDVAQSLLSSFISSAIHRVSPMANWEKIRYIYYGGNFFRHEQARAEAIKSLKVFFSSAAMETKFLKISHLAALGAMLTQPPDVV